MPLGAVGWGVQAYPSRGFGLIENHPFLDGNRRVGFVTANVFLILNGHEVEVRRRPGSQACPACPVSPTFAAHSKTRPPPPFIGAGISSAPPSQARPS